MDIFLDIIPSSILFFFISFVLIYLISSSSIKRFFIDRPDKRKVHYINIPRIGGFCIIISFFLTIITLIIAESSAASFWVTNSVGLSILSSAFLVFIIGFLDDTTFIEVSSIHKLIVQFIIAAIVVFAFNIYISDFTFLGRVHDLGLMGPIITIFWIVGVINAFNIIDGIDGLMGSLTLVTLLFSTIIFLIVGDGAYKEYMIITLPIIAIILAFLKYNYSPAKIFAGDTGSLFFGSVAAILSVKIASFSNQGIETLTAFYIVAFPITEMLISMIRRYFYGQKDKKPIKERIKMTMIADNRHIHHRLINKGYTHERVLYFIVSFALLFAFCAISLILLDNKVLKILILIYSFYAVFRVIDYLDYGKKFLYLKKGFSLIDKYIMVFTNNQFFKSSLVSAAGKNYLVEQFESIIEKYKKKRIEAFIIYNESDDFIERDINKIYEIREFFNTDILFISSVQNFEKYSQIISNEKNVYFIEQPCDVSMLIYNIEKKSYFGNINEGEINVSKN